MRLRNKPFAKDTINNHPEYVISNPDQYKGSFNKLFNQNQPIHIEIGTGRGLFITEMAKANPHINFVGIEKYTSVAVDALKKVISSNVSNVKLLNKDGSKILEYFGSGEVTRIYLNFSDPWPKARHEKRRLTHHNFLSMYKKILDKKGDVHFKTDNQSLFEYSLVSMSTYGMIIKEVSLDLHNSNFKDNIMTEYEKKFSSKGNLIYRTEATYK